MYASCFDLTVIFHALTNPNHSAACMGPVSTSDKTSYRKISWSLEAARFVSKIVRSLWNLTGTSAAVLPTCQSNFKAMRWFKLPISQLRDFARSYDKTSYRILKRGPGHKYAHVFTRVNVGLCHGCWCMGSLSRQGNRGHVTDKNLHDMTVSWRLESRTTRLFVQELVQGESQWNTFSYESENGLISERYLYHSQ